MTHYRPFEPLLPPSAVMHGTMLVVAPHPDDEVVGCGGVMLAHREAGHAVHVAVMTDGCLGNPTGQGGSSYTDLRRRELLRAGDLLGGISGHFLNHPDGSLKETLVPAEELVLLMDRIRPASLFFPSPYEVHPDHRASSLLVFRALRQVEKPPALYLFEVGAMMPANLLVDITPYMLQKEQALQAYQSQLLHQDILGKIRALNRGRTVNVDDPAVRYAEAFIQVLPEQAEAFLEAVERVLSLTDGMGPGSRTNPGGRKEA